MKFKGQPNEAVFTMIRSSRKGKPRRVYLFTFDENGEHEIDVSKISDATLAKIKRNYEVVEDSPDLDSMKRAELFALAREVGAEAKPPIRNAEIIKAIKEVM